MPFPRVGNGLGLKFVRNGSRGEEGLNSLGERLLLLRLIGVVGIGHSRSRGGCIDGIRRRPGSHRATGFGGLFPLHLQLLGLSLALLASLEFLVLYERNQPCVDIAARREDIPFQ